MYFYEIGTVEFEGDSTYTHQYAHEKEFTEREIEEIVFQGIIKVIEHYTDNFDEKGNSKIKVMSGWQGEGGGLTYFDAMAGDVYSDKNEDIFNNYLKDKGFIKIEYAVRFVKGDSSHCIRVHQDKDVDIRKEPVQPLTRRIEKEVWDRGIRIEPSPNCNEGLRFSSIS